MTFKVGDKVRRESLSKGVLDYNGMRVGDWDVVTHVDRFSIDLKSYGRGHDPDCFTLVKEPSPATTPHKWAKEIKAWADGAEIQFRTLAPAGWTEWATLESSPAWSTVSTVEYRVKPEKKPDVIEYGTIMQGFWSSSKERQTASTVQFTFDGETGKLKAVQLLSN